MKILLVFLFIIGSVFTIPKAENDSQKEELKKFHFFYIGFSDLSNKAYVINAISDSIANLSVEKDEFLLFISNGKNSSFYNSIGSTEEIITELNSINPFAPNIKDDFDKINNYLNEKDIVFTTDLTNPLHLQYSNLSFNYFFDEKYIDDCVGFFVDRFININEFEYLENTGNIYFTFYMEKSSRNKLPIRQDKYKIRFYTFN